MSPSYIVLPDTAPHSLWAFFPDTSFIYRLPRPAREPLSRADIYASLDHGSVYLDDAMDAFRAGEHCDVLSSLEVLRGLLEVAIAQISASFPEHLVH
jgi:hypothetical protein